MKFTGMRFANTGKSPPTDLRRQTAGTIPGFAYSTLNKAAGENGLIWTEDNIFEYLADPNAFLKKFLTDKGKPDLANGSTKMVFKVPSEKERRDVIVYIKTFADVK